MIRAEYEYVDTQRLPIISSASGRENTWGGVHFSFMLLHLSKIAVATSELKPRKYSAQDDDAGAGAEVSSP